MPTELPSRILVAPSDSKELPSLDSNGRCCNRTAGSVNAVGWAVSFAWRFGTDKILWTKTFTGVDMTLRTAMFRAAPATAGFWAALNNLGVIWA